MAIFAKKPDAKGLEKTKTETDLLSGEPPVVEEPVTDEAALASSTGDGAVGLVQVDIAPVEIEPEAAGTSPDANVFGIADAIRLMRSLPSDPMDLVVRVVRLTLGAVNVSVEDIMEDARRKETSIQENVAALEAQVADLEKQLYARRCEIAAHEADLAETAHVRERLYQADKYTGQRPPPTPPDAARIPLSKLAEWGKSDHIKGE
jgi:hypothetical protein